MATLLHKVFLSLSISPGCESARCEELYFDFCTQNGLHLLIFLQVCLFKSSKSGVWSLMTLDSKFTIKNGLEDRQFKFIAFKSPGCSFGTVYRA